MDSRHKKQAIAGVVVWVCAMPVFLVVGVMVEAFIKSHNLGCEGLGAFIFLGSLAVQYVAFFWGGGHLARAKGYSTGMLLFGLIWPAQLIVLAVLLFGLPDRCVQHSSLTRRKRRHVSESPIDRVVRFRRNALIAVVFGLLGVLIALSLVVFPFGPFVRRDNNLAAATLVFVPSYAAVIYGCWFWLKAKFWNEAVVLIGVAPVLILFIPYVRLIFLAAPLLLPAAMVIMPVILLGVIAALPDKSGL